MSFLLLLLSALFGLSTAQESIYAHEGINVAFHCGLALTICFGILGTCAIGVNIVTRKCARYMLK